MSAGSLGWNEWFNLVAGVVGWSSHVGGKITWSHDLQEDHMTCSILADRPPACFLFHFISLSLWILVELSTCRTGHSDRRQDGVSYGTVQRERPYRYKQNNCHPSHFLFESVWINEQFYLKRIFDVKEIFLFCRDRHTKGDIWHRQWWYEIMWLYQLS